TPHPTDRTLAALIDGRLSTGDTDVVGAHVRRCGRCQLRIGSADLGEGVAVLAVPTAMPVPLRDEHRDELPVRGDLRRLTWDADVMLAVIWRVDPDRVAVLPTVSIADADEWVAVFDDTTSGGLGDLAVSVALETTVPW